MPIQEPKRFYLQLGAGSDAARRSVAVPDLDIFSFETLLLMCATNSFLLTGNQEPVLAIL
jgi:hypothetical protein